MTLADAERWLDWWLDDPVRWLSETEWICGCGDHHQAEDDYCLGCEDERPPIPAEKHLDAPRGTVLQSTAEGNTARGGPENEQGRRKDDLHRGAGNAGAGREPGDR